MPNPRPRRTARVHRATTVLAAAALTATAATAVTAGEVSASASPAGRVVVAHSTLDKPWLNPKEKPATRAAQLVKAMTLADEVQMLHGVDSSQSPVPTVGYIPPIPRLGVPPITMTDGPAGVRNGQKSTELPAPIAVAASWDTALAKQYGTVLGRDARDLGQDQVFGPGMNIDRVPLNGRNFEYFSEDPYLSGTIAGSDVRGIQSQGTIATIKHYVANNDETNRTTVSANIDDRTLHEIYEKNFGIAVADGHPGSVMCSYNRINTVYSCSNPTTLGSLRSQFGFDGYVVSDYPATHATTDINAGLNVELPTGVYLTLPAVQAALTAGTITRTTIDTRVRQTLTVLFRFGIFDRALTVDAINQAKDDAAAQAIEEQSAVLLKNDGALPLSTQKSIAVIGTTAKTSAQGGGSSQVDPLSIDNAYDALVTRAAKAGASVSYADGSDTTAAAQTAEAAQTALVFVRDTSSEGSDRSTLELSGNQDALIQAVAAANPHTVVVLETGAPVLMPWLSSVQGVLEAWYPGARGGAAIARLLYGDVDPSGRLQQTWPVSDSQVPASTPAQFPGVNGQETYSEGVDVGYRWYDQHDQTPLFPFGYGLSYTHFAYSHLRLAHASGTSRNAVTMTVDVRNTGTRTGSEVVQAYVAKPHRLASTPPRELGAFAKVRLAPGRTTTVRLTIAARELSYWDSAAQAFTVQDGTYTVAVGGSSRSLPVHGAYRVTRTDGPVRLTVSPTTRTVTAGSSLTVAGTLRNLSDYTDRGARVSVTAPAGWKVTPRTVTTAASLKPGRSLLTRFSVAVPSSAKGGTYPVTVTARGIVDGRAVSTSQVVTVTVPYASLTAAYDTVGLTSNSNPAPGNWDPSGYSYSAENLAAKGVTPGAPVTVGGSTVTFSAQAPGTPDAVTARGQVIRVGASTAHLVLLGAATNGEVKATVAVTYTDGSTQAVPVDFNDWYSNAATAGTSIVATAQWNQPPGGIGAHDVSIYGQAVPVDGSRTIATITLPSAPNLHFFTVSPEQG